MAENNVVTIDAFSAATSTRHHRAQRVVVPISSAGNANGSSSSSSSTHLKGAANMDSILGETAHHLVALEPTTLPFPTGLTDLAGSNDPMLIVGGATVAVLGLGLTALVSSFTKKGKAQEVEEESEPEPEPVDVSIPYDAAVILAYTQWRNEEPDLKSEFFAQFKKLYLEKTIAEVSMKEKSRRFERLIASS
jgi:hypothetical protein